MRPNYGLFQQQAANMSMTPQLRQAIRILQLPTPDLLDYIQLELYENPMLDFSQNGWDVRKAGSTRNEDHDPLQFAVSNELSLERHLKEQLSFVANIPQSIHRIILFMIRNLDQNGYLIPSLQEISGFYRVQLEQVEFALKILQGFEPTGVAARNLRECLLLQVRQRSDFPPLVPILLQNHLEDVADFHVHKLSATLQVSSQDVRTAIDAIKELNPRPGAAFRSEEIRYILPDVIIQEAGGQFVVMIRDAAAPHLTVNPEYERMMKQSEPNHEVRSFLAEKLQSAMFLRKCIEQRRRTMLRVTRAIVEEQIEFFRKGTLYLKPMTLKQIADTLNVHESTVSRSTAGKYAQTPWGVFELKYFFPSGLPTELGDLASSERVKIRLKQLVSGENERKPYSDQQLSKLLLQEGIQVSRRTVSKYREELAIPSSVRRKRT
jgi:RNA polymerase sigma-54 factor